MKKLLGYFLLAVFGFSLLSCGTNFGVYPDADKYLVGNQIYDEDVSSLDIDWVSGGVTLIEDKSIVGVKIEEYTDLTKIEEQVHSYFNNGELKIKFFASGYRKNGSWPFKKDLVVTYHPGLDNFNLNLTSGSCNADSLTASQCHINITSGDVNIKKINANNVSANCTSGNITLNKMEVNEFVSSMTSGGLTVEFITVTKASFTLTSGDLNMTLPTDGGKVNISKTSGSVTTNRECVISGNTYSFGMGLAAITVSMTSGSVVIY